MDNGIANLKLAQNQLKVYRQALLKAAFEGKLTEQWRKENNPEPAEKRVFWPYLIRQLEIIQPKAVVTLGRHSGMAFIPDLHISRDHGNARWAQYHELKFLVIPLYHPAAALYNGGLRLTLIDDFLKVTKTIDQNIG